MAHISAAEAAASGRRPALPIFSDASRWTLLQLAVAALAIFFAPAIAETFLLEKIARFYLIALGLNLLVGYTGLVSLGHAGLYALGAYTSGILSARLGLPLYLTFPIAVAVATAAGALLALPALRVRGPYLAMLTIAFGLVIEIVANRLVGLTGGPDGMSVPRPQLGGYRLQMVDYWYVIGATALLGQAILNNLTSARVGRTLLALRGSEVAAETVGVNVYRWKVLAFAVSAAYAGLAGAFFAHRPATGFLNTTSFQFDDSIMFLVIVILGGAGTRYGPLVGAVVLAVLQEALATQAELRLIIYGAVLLLALVFAPEGIVGTIAKLPAVARLRRAWWPPARMPDLVPAWAGATRSLDQRDQPILIMQGVSKDFGGLRAVDEVDMQIMPGKIHALIGPNGAGKSTMVNLITGIYAPTTGTITYRGENVNDLPPHALARRGATRTFQNLQLFGDLDVRQHVLVGFHTALKAHFFDHMLRTRKALAEEQQYAERALALLDVVGLRDRALQPATSLPYGDQRRLEIARALAIEPVFLLLDEPAAGVNPTEIQALSELIVRIRDTGVTILVIEHHMELVMGISNHIAVLDFGRKIAEGTPVAIQAQPEVIAAYLGTPESSEIDVGADNGVPRRG
ncbi:MAG TPA: branched-chain amino acid ABC transporter ATP-binding protein/permease [Roseiflexaceae bacterium]|nr:branched-chain amino acid ABC transporter ATP-binding protein/permease [Roseiflexaceae bacterium]